MKNKVLILTILLILLFININYIKAVEVTDNNKNEKVTEKDSSGKDYTTYYVNDGVTGNEMQAIKVAVYRKNGKMVEGTTPKYIKLKDGYGNTIYNTCSCKNDTYNLTKITNKTLCSCTNSRNGVVIQDVDGITGTKKYWFTDPNPWGSDGIAFVNMMNKNDYANVIKALELLGYKNSDGTYKYQEGDYLIAEPYVTVSCTDFAGVSKSSGKKYISGTINSLIGANMSYNGGQKCGQYIDFNGVTEIFPAREECYRGICTTYPAITVPFKVGDQKSLYIWVYSSIAQTFKTSSSCTTNGKPVHGAKPLNTSNYSGCGYDMWLLDDIPILQEKPHCTYKDNKYYDANGIATTKTNYEKSCFCATVPNTNPQQYYDKDGNKTSNYNAYRESCYKKTPCTTETKKDQNGKTVTAYYGIDGYEVADVTAYKTSCGCKVSNVFSTGFSDPDGKATSETNYLNKCKKCAERVTANPVERINLYKNYVAINTDPLKNYRSLLNFSLNVSSDTGKASACTNGEAYVIDKSCLNLSSNANNKFDHTNLSKYTYTIENGSKTLYCNNVINLSSNIGTSWNVTSGMAYIGGKSTTTNVASGTAEATCYLYSNNITNSDLAYDPFDNYTYNKIISKITLGGKELTAANITTNTTTQTKGTYNGATYVKYYKKYSLNYYTPKVYIDKNTGDNTTEQSSNKIERYGIYSRLSDKGKYNVNFSVSVGSDSNIKFNEVNGSCYYNATPGIVINNALALEFRTIDTANPFANEDGNGRQVGANWCSVNSMDLYDCSNTNALVQSRILTKNNSYNVMKQTPKYKIVLTSKEIAKIREYNKSLPLDQHEKCASGVCTNTFFNEIKSSIKTGSEYLTK